METFGYNLKDNFISIFRNEIVNNLHFGFGTRSNTEWGSGILLYVNAISTALGDEHILSDIENTDTEYFMTFFDKDFNDNHIFKVIKAGKLTSSLVLSWNSKWLLIEKLSKDSSYFNATDYPDIDQNGVANLESKSFETLLSEQTSSNISKKFKLYKLYDNGIEQNFYELTLLDDELESLQNVESSLYNTPMDSRLISVGNAQVTYNHFQNLKHITNIDDGSYSKCYNLSLNTINKIQTNEINLTNIVFDLVNNSNITIISGLVFKSLIQISKIDYALVFEYATQTGSKNLTITTENFIDNNGTEQIGIFMDSNLDLINTNSGKISPIDINLLTNTIFKNSLTFDYASMILETNKETFLKYLLNKAFIEHNKINTNKIYFVTKIDLSGSGWTVETINGETYYKGNVIGDEAIAEIYNIKNFLIEINLNDDFKFNYNQIYDMYRSSTGYEIRNSASTSYSLNSERIREIVLYYKDSFGIFTPIYYSRVNITINNNGDYKFRIII